MSKKSQILKLSLIAFLLVIAPLLSTSIRPTYLYFLLNLLIFAISAEAGLLSSSSKSKDDNVKTDSTITTPKPFVSSKAHTVEKSSSDKKINVGGEVIKVKKCPSMPSLFFIGGGDEAEAEEAAAAEEQEDEEVAALSGQELCQRPEMFIGKFYDQLKMQREESWKKIHGRYRKTI